MRARFSRRLEPMRLREFTEDVTHGSTMPALSIYTLTGIEDMAEQFHQIEATFFKLPRLYPQRHHARSVDVIAIDVQVDEVMLVLLQFSSTTCPRPSSIIFARRRKPLP